MNELNFIFPDDYATEEIEVKLTAAEIDVIVDELNRAEHGIFTFMGYDKIIDKLRRKDEGEK